MNVNHDDMKNILFVQDPGEYRLLDSYMGYIPKVSDKEDLYTKLSEGLSFPVLGGTGMHFVNYIWISIGLIQLILLLFMKIFQSYLLVILEHI